MDEKKDKPSSTGTRRSGVTRRRFIAQSLAVTSAAAVSGMLPRVFAATKTTCPKETLLKILPITSKKGTLKGVLKIKNGRKSLPAYKGGQQPMMRYFEGYDQQPEGGKIDVWPPKELEGKCLPGPTLRVAVGEKVEITFLNQVDVGAFPGGTLDAAEQGLTTGCDQATNGTTDPPDKNWYAGTRGDTFPNCFHGSSTANLHFHGTHVTPDGFGDNVLVQVRPDPKITEAAVEPYFKEIFAACDGSTPPWSKLPEDYRNAQKKAVKDYDMTAIWQNVRGPIKDSSGNDIPALPKENQLTPVNDEETGRDRWPQYFIGAFPNCFRITEAAGHTMGQSPGTHWYHSHKHGSTSINLYNGLSGALIIEGDYDKDLKNIYPKLKEKVLVVQTFTDQPDLERVGAGAKLVTTNGGDVVAAVKANPTATPPVVAKPQQAPTIVMQPGEIQLWRIINAHVSTTINGTFTLPAGATAPTDGTAPRFRQIAQDGVQFKLENFKKQPLTSPDPNSDPKYGTKFALVAGGRIDILVKAPAAAGSFELSGIANLEVCGDAVNDPWPTDENYPTFPPFLHDLPRPGIFKDLTFDWEPFRIRTGAAANASGNVKATHAKQIPFPVEIVSKDGKVTKIEINPNRGPYFMIDNEQFREHKYYQTMILGDEEEWKIINTTGTQHPFHIHVNPFQVVEVFDPNPGGVKFVAETDGVWQDVVSIPPALKDSGGNLLVDAKTGRATTPGYIRIRSKFVDFTGSFVLHCHILAHEDRGMMQLVRVIDGATTLRHH